MNDLIRRQDVENAIQGLHVGDVRFFEKLRKNIDDIPSVEPKVIHCCDCKWWDRLDEGHPYGYCLACRSGTHTERWDISIYRQCKFDFYCADAEPRNDAEEEGEQ